MANKPLKSIKFPELPDTYTIPQVDTTPTQGSSNAVSSGGVYSALAGKVDAETGKGLSTNDYSDAEKAKVDNLKDSIGELIPLEIVPDVVGYINTNVSPVDINNPIIPPSGGWRYKLVACQEGDEFTVYGRYLGTAADLYTFVDAEYNVLERSVDKDTNDTYYPVAPANSAYVIFQRSNASPNRFWKGIAIDKKIESISNAVDNVEIDIQNIETEISDLISDLSPIFTQNITGWKNQGIAPSTGAVSANAKRLKATIPYTALSCYVDSGYSFLVFGWDGDTYLGWWDGTAWSKNTMVLRTTELDLTSISDKTLYAILVHGTTTAGAVDISTDESVHFYIKCKTDFQLNIKNVPADAYSVGSKFEAVDENVDELQRAVFGSQFFVQNLDGWENIGIVPETGAAQVNTRRLRTDVPYTARSCYVDSGYSFLIFGWDEDTYLGWYDGIEFVKTSMVPRTTELDITSIASYKLRAILIHGTTLQSADYIDLSEGIHFYTKNKTDSLLNTKNVPADAFSVGEKISNARNEISSAVKTIVANDIITLNTKGYIKTNVSPVDPSTINAATGIYYGVYSCEPAEVFTLKGSDPGSVAGYCVFVDASYNVLKREPSHNDYEFVQAPENSAYVIFQQTSSAKLSTTIIRGKWTAKVIDRLSSKVDNIDDMVCGYRSTSYFESDDTQDVITDYGTLISMYDALVTANSNYITKNALTYGDFTNYEYVFSMGDRNSGNGQRSKDAITEKPLVLIMAGTHGHERCSIMGLFLFAKALCESPELSPLRNGLTIKIIPVVCPSGYNANTRVNANGVNINRNFDGNWRLTSDDGMNYSGASAADQDETQVVQAWMNANTDAVIGIDWHNSAFTNEVCYFATCISTGFAVDAKKGYFYGLDHITSHWINDRDISGSNVIYGYVGTDNAPGTSYAYAKTIDLKWCLFETSWNVGTYGKDTAETIGVNAEAFCALMKGVLEKYINQT